MRQGSSLHHKKEDLKMENHNEKTYEMKQYELCLEWFEFMTNDLFIQIFSTRM